MYRTAPEKPVEVRVKLTPEEVVEAVLNYASEVKGIHVPEEFEAQHVQVHLAKTPGGGNTGQYAPKGEGYPVHVVWSEES
jgi:hypothetical protein